MSPSHTLVLESIAPRCVCAALNHYEKHILLNRNFPRSGTGRFVSPPFFLPLFAWFSIERWTKTCPLSRRSASDGVTFELPVHLRYQLPQKDVNSARACIDPPRVAISCDKNKEWKFVAVQNGQQACVAVPVGRMDDVLAVKVGTIAVTMLGALVFSVVLYMHVPT
eukprot:NODE_9971_length_616_cov_2.718053_g9701_i0.p1 GENE.NODE_9971_length_616_cov_2.718053_g9701_i0~~NODE_9971_length_616_cov_2.718053_g9701_i0.p1  ORF type:complete len:166 (+),score=9.81 NODE_9971_length_616_cov_2.718053_g9701_i0:97-594(+)